MSLFTTDEPGVIETRSEIVAALVKYDERFPFTLRYALRKKGAMSGDVLACEWCTSSARKLLGVLSEMRHHGGYVKAPRDNAIVRYTYQREYAGVVVYAQFDRRTKVWSICAYLK